MRYSAKVRGETFEFPSLKEVFAKSNEEKSGDKLAGIAASSAAERIAAKRILSETTLEELYNNPLIPPDKDEVSRVIYESVRMPIYNQIKNWTVAGLREYLLADTTTSEDISYIRHGLTSEMIAAVCKIMSNLDLIYAASKAVVITHCNNTLGLKGTLNARLQPNHPTDDVEGILWSLREGLSYGMGDAVIGINPVNDSVASVSRLMEATHEVITEFRIPTQNSVLAHITTQMEAVRKGAPVSVFFQSIAGTEKGNKAFGISVALLDEAHEVIKKHSTSAGPNFMYFETGQGSELSSDAHEGVDQLTLEARCYGLAKRYNPLIVNTVVGFIGPEYLYDSRQVIRAGLEDHFMGKLTGVPMGCDACYTNHMKADQKDIENLAVLLTAANCNYFIGVPMGDDVMLNYQCTSYHDLAALRQLLGLRPAPEFECWLEEMGLMKNGMLTERAGDPRVFVKGGIAGNG
ncbi:MAG: ethanolamine ammonia-lyase subunit EutB [Thermacetogeniaceae bacterium]|jgi:ethanolamine ammonia-lyase large subunit|nr:ethanolamine ammonia-lyase subunit EutB [Syntrophomonadaceae bacterium]